MSAETNPPNFTVSGRIERPVEEVFAAVVEPDQLSKYFTTGGAQGRLDSGATVEWDFHDFPGAFPVEVVEVVDNQRIVLRWDVDKQAGTVDGSSWTTVTMEFEQLDDGRTLLSISEHGWRLDDPSLRAAFGNCEGWTGMLIALKVWLEHELQLRQGFYT